MLMAFIVCTHLAMYTQSLNREAVGQCDRECKIRCEINLRTQYGEVVGNDAAIANAVRR